MNRSLVKRYSPLSMMTDPFDVFNAIFSDPFADRNDGVYLRSRVENNKNDYTFTLEVPGFSEDEINIDLKDRSLEITADHKENSDGKYFHQSVQRAWSLPRGVNENDVSAILKNGVLTVVVPKKEATETKKVQVKALKE